MSENEMKELEQRNANRHEDGLIDLFDPFYDLFGFNRGRLFNSNGSSLMRTDVRDLGDQYQMEIELPGIQKSDITINLKEGYLVIQANRSANHDENNHGYVVKERFNGTFKRSWYVGENLTKSDIHAKLDGGVLTITFPKENKRAAEDNSVVID